MTEKEFDKIIKAGVEKLESPFTEGLFEQVKQRMEQLGQTFDKKVKTQMEDYESFVPENMWERITKEQEREKRRPIIWWWTAAGILILAGCIGIYIVQDIKQKNNFHSDLNSLKSFQNNNDSQRNFTNVPGHINQLNNKKISTGYLLSSQEELVNNGHAKSSKDNIKKQQLEPIPQTPATNDGVTKTSNLKEIKNNSSLKDVFVAKNRKSKFDYNQPSNKIRQNTISNIKISSDEKAGKHEHIDDEILSSNIIISEQEEEVRASISSYEEELLKFNELVRASLKRLLPKQLLQANFNKPYIPCPTADKSRRNDWYIDIYASPLMQYKRLSNNNISKSISNLDSPFNKQLSFNAGINLVKNVSDNLLLKTGLQYNQFNELMRLTRINERKIITTVTVRSVIIAPGDTVHISDTSTIEQIGTIKRQVQNHYKQFDIPFIISYEFGGKGLKLNANLGLIANIQSYYKGEIVDTLNQAASISNYKGNTLYKSNIGFGLYAGISFLKSFNNRTDLFIEPHARLNLGNMTTGAAWFKQKNIIAGISVGIRYKLNARRQRY